MESQKVKEFKPLTLWKFHLKGKVFLNEGKTGEKNFERESESTLKGFGQQATRPPYSGSFKDTLKTKGTSSLSW